MLFLLCGCAPLLLLGCDIGPWDLLRDGEYEPREYGRGWLRKMSLSVAIDVAETLHDVPMLITLTPDRFSYDLVKEDGSDLGFYKSDGVTPMAFELEEWNPEGRSLLWVTLPELPAEGAAESFWLFYSSGINAATDSVEDVWPDDYRGVWHYSGVSDEILHDSTRNRNDWNSSSGELFAGTSPDNPLGGGFFLDNKISATLPINATLLSLPSLTLSMWVLIESRTVGVPLEISPIRLRIPELSPQTSSTILQIEAENKKGWIVRSLEWEKGSWHNLVIAWNEPLEQDSLSVYVDGKLHNGEGSFINKPSEEIDPFSDDGVIGRTEKGLGVVGAIDELRISNKARAAEWIRVQHLIQSGAPDLVTYGEEIELR